MARLEAEHERLPTTLKTRTPRGGLHLLFAWDPERPVPNSCGKVGAGIDIRGDGGYIIVPPSKRGDGASYQWENPPEQFRPVPAPAWLYSLVFAKRNRKDDNPHDEADFPHGKDVFAFEAGPGARERAYARAAFDGAVREVEFAAPGGRNNTLNAVAYRLGRMIARGWLSRAEVEVRLLAAATVNGLVAEDGQLSVEATIRSGIEAGLKNPHDGLHGPEGDPKESASGEERADPLLQTSSRFVSGFVPPDYLWDGVLQRRFCYSFTAQTGAGKTAVALLLAASAALGLVLGGRQVERGRVLYFAGENPDDVRMRWIAMAEHMSFDIDTIDVHFIPGVFSIDALGAKVRAEVERLGGVALVIVDTSAAYFPGDAENDNVQLGAHARRMRKLTTLPGGPTVLVNCHPVKNAAADNMLPRGGGAFLAEVDGNLTGVRNETLTTVHWQGKFRGPDFERIPFEMCPVTAARLKDSKGRNVPTVIAKALSDAEQQERAAAIQSNEDAVLVFLMDREGEGNAGPLSMAALAEGLRWRVSTSGKPHKSKAERALKKLGQGKLITMERLGPELTDKGRKEAKKIKYNRDAAGGTYG